MSSVLRRMLAPPAPPQADVPLTAGRAVRLAMSRAAEDSIGLSVSVQGVAEESATLDELIRTLTPTQGLIQLTRPGNGPPSQEDLLVGIAVLDPQFANAVLELQTTGSLSPDAPEERPLTSADLALAHPLLLAFFAEMAETTANTVLDGWTKNVTLGHRIENPRAAGLILPDVAYRVIQVGMDLGAAERQGELWIVLPGPANPGANIASPRHQENWSEKLEEVVMAAPAALRAVLHRFDMSLAAADALHEGQIIPLTGCTVGSARLEGPTGEVVAKARLGQVAGHIAVRIEEPQIQMTEGLGASRNIAPLSPTMTDLGHRGGMIDAVPMAGSGADPTTTLATSDAIDLASDSLDNAEIAAPPMMNEMGAEPEDNQEAALPEIATPMTQEGDLPDPTAGDDVSMGTPMMTGNFDLTGDDEPG